MIKWISVEELNCENPLTKNQTTWCKSGVVKNVTEQHKVPHHISFGVNYILMGEEQGAKLYYKST